MRKGGGGCLRWGKGVGVRGQNKEAKWEKNPIQLFWDGQLTARKWSASGFWQFHAGNGLQCEPCGGKKKYPLQAPHPSKPPTPKKICKKNFNLASSSIIRFLVYHVLNIYIWEIRGPKLGPKTEYISAWFSAILSNFWEFKPIGFRLPSKKFGLVWGRFSF